MRLGLLVSLGLLAGLLGATLLFDALPGINWTLWTLVAIAGLIAYRQPDPETRKQLALPLGFAALLAIGASVNATPVLDALVVLLVASLLALAVLVAPDESPVRDYGALYIITAPLHGLARTVRGTVSALAAIADAAGGTRDKPVLKGAIIATPVVIVLALLFATADPILARGRDSILDALTTLESLPRIIFGLLVALFVIGAYMASVRTFSRIIPSLASTSPTTSIGLTERRVVLYAAAAISWLFVILQLSYLFGTHPADAGSGITFAEYAHRGFAELTVAATGVALLIVAAHQRLPGSDETRAHSALMWPSLTLLAAVGCILYSALHRIALYEAAYGYTTMRVYAQAYMLVTLGALAVVTWHVVRRFEVRSLARGVMTVALSGFTLLLFWNADAWVARENVNRYTRTGKVDVEYLAKGLSDDAYPALIESLSRLGPVEGQQLTTALAKRIGADNRATHQLRWYEWNLRRSRARTMQMTAATR